MNQLAAHGGPITFDIAGPHYQWPYLADGGLEKAVEIQIHRSLSDRDSSGVLGEFERLFAEFVGVDFAVSFSSGTAAIHAMSRAIGLKPGDAIIAPAYTFLATASPFGFDGVEVRFADADVYGNVTAETLAAQLTDNVKAVIVTHMWGNPCQMDDIVQFCTDHGLLVLEDCSHAHFASYNGRRVGTFGDMAVFSCNQKAITTGEGGVLVTRHERYRDLALLYGHYNKRSLTEINPDREYYPFAFTGMGLKERMHTLAAAIGVHQLHRADEIERRRRTILDRFAMGLGANPVIRPLVAKANRAMHGLYVAGLSFHPENATVTRDEFVRLCVAEGATMVDAPGSTRDISAEPLFRRHDPFAAWRLQPAVDRPVLPGVAAFQNTFVKTPLWGYDGDLALVEGYLAALRKVSTAVAK
jgi:perosamine synthetase